ncbi:unnamed protein product, partial [Urochloa humidicola]
HDLTLGSRPPPPPPCHCHRHHISLLLDAFPSSASAASPRHRTSVGAQDGVAPGRRKASIHGSWIQADLQWRLAGGGTEPTRRQCGSRPPDHARCTSWSPPSRSCAAATSSRFLFFFPGLLTLAPSRGRVRELADLGTKNSVLCLEFHQGRMKLSPKHVYPKNKYLTLLISEGCRL